MADPIKILLVDDEFRARQTLRNLLDRFIEDVEVVGDAASVEVAVEMIKAGKPDLVFLDIQMPTQTGFALLEEYVLPAFEVIFITAYAQHAIRALRLQAFDYLVKPVDIEELQEAVNRFRQKKQHLVPSSSASKSTSPGKSLNKVVLPTQDGYLLADLDSILRCEASGPYTVFHLDNGKKIVATRSLKVFEQQFQDQFFQRIHHKDLVNLRYVQEVNSRENYLRLSDDSIVWISLRKKSALMKRLKEM